MIPSAVVLIITLIMAFQYLGETDLTTWLITTLVITAICTLVIIGGYREYNIYYDDENMYLKQHKHVRVIPFINVRCIKMTLSNMKVMGFWMYKYKIVYRDPDGNLAEVFFWTSLTDKKIEQFGGKVKAVNPYLRIEHYATSSE